MDESGRSIQEKAVGFSRFPLAGPSARLTPLDWVFLVNLTLFGVLSAYLYWDRFVSGRKAGNVREFFVYACLLLVLLGWVWLRLRSVHWRWALMGAVQLSVVMSFAGGLYVRTGVRLYDIRLLPIGDFRFDKPIHIFNSVIVGLVLGALLRAYGERIGRPRAVVMVLLIVGVGAFWEIAEYLVVKTLRDAGVGDYDNNMQDMIANLAGALVYILLPERWRAPFEEPPRRSPAKFPPPAEFGPGCDGPGAG
jgi:cell shape-determining protein MreD